MERIRILAAAAALPEFTIAELCAYAGANERTVRSVVKREGVTFEELAGTERRSGGGRPRKRYRLSDVERIRMEVRTLESELNAFAVVPKPDAVADDEQERIDAVLVAEDALIRSWEDSGDRERQVALAATARRTLSSVLRSGECGQPWQRRAEALVVLSDLAERDGREESLEVADLARGAGALSILAEFLPRSDVERRLLPGLEQAATRNGHLPPVILLTDGTSTPAEVAPRLNMFRWECQWVSQISKRVWSQEWAVSLLDCHLVSGAVVQFSAGGSYDLVEDVEAVREWNVPTIVVSEVQSMDNPIDVVAKAAELGAHFLPSTADVTALTNTMFNSRGREVDMDHATWSW